MNEKSFYFVYFSLLSQRDDWVESDEIDKITGGYPVLNKKEILDIQQYTGLKDKNGKEIYEGDILEGSLGTTIEIYWHDEFAQFLSRTKSSSGLGIGNTSSWEIIGNIYENPELLSTP